MVSLKKGRLLNPYFWGGCTFGWGWLISNNIAFLEAFYVNNGYEPIFLRGNSLRGHPAKRRLCFFRNPSHRKIVDIYGTLWNYGTIGFPKWGGENRFPETFLCKSSKQLFFILDVKK